MYAQSLNQPTPDAGGPEDADQLARFQARIDDEQRVEPNDWMPAAYRKTLVRQISHTRCRLDDNWGYDRNGVWVDRGCSAEFQVGRSRGHGDRDEDLARAAGAVAGVALVAALVSTSKSQEPKEVASWAVGTFRGYDREERTDVEINGLDGLALARVVKAVGGDDKRRQLVGGDGSGEAVELPAGGAETGV